MSRKFLRKSILSDILPNPKRERARFNMTLGSFAKALTRERQVLNVFTNTQESLGKVHAYPGYQGDVAFCVTKGGPPVTVAELLQQCNDIMDRTVQGPKGPTTITAASPVWVCNTLAREPFTMNTVTYAVVDVIPDNGIVKIILVEK